jgi:ribosome biogenesis GTPase
MEGTGMTLERLGWDGTFAAHYAPHAAEGDPARVAIQQKGHYLLYGAHGELRGEVAGRIHFAARGPADFPAVGDWVVARGHPGGGEATIRLLLPRKSEFSRKVAGDRPVKQVLAANIDVVFLVSSLDAEFNLRRLERYLAVAAGCGALPVVVLNKADLRDDAEEIRASVRESVGDVKVLLASAKENTGVDAIEAFLAPGKTGALLGHSGAGKSTILNRLLGQERMRTQDVRDTDSKGRHTTTHRELVLLPKGGLLIDTPGMRELQLWEDGEESPESFNDIDELALQCRFSDCRHDTEPGCAVRAAIDEERLDPDRLEHYFKLRRELAYQARRTSTKGSLEEKKKAKRLALEIRRYNRDHRKK